MTDAVNQPVRRRRETSTTEFTVGEMDPIDLTGEEDRPSRIVEADSTALKAEYTQAIAFAEEPVTIMVSKGNDRNAALVVDCWVNGKGAELLINGKWREAGWIPCDREVTTKRKYVEVLLRSKTTSYMTEHSEPGAQYIQNRAVPSTNLRNNVSVLEDKHPLGRAWLSSIVSERE